MLDDRSLEERILDVLRRAHMPLKASAIASEIGATRHEVNSRLYGSLHLMVESDDSFRWQLRERPHTEEAVFGVSNENPDEDRTIEPPAATTLETGQPISPEFGDFLSRIAEIQADSLATDLEKARKALHEIASFFYFQTRSVPNDYISAFHVWWEKHAKSVVAPFIDEDQCRKVARVLEQHFSRVGIDSVPFPPPREIGCFQIANCRFFSAAQDYGGRFRRSPFDLLEQDPGFFSPTRMLDASHVDEFLRWIGAEAQYDKRRDFAIRGAKWLIENFGGEAYNLYEAHGRSVRKLTQTMTSPSLGLGYSAKKCHMFVRDLFDWKVWEPDEDIHALDVASDANTMRVALRTGVLRLGIPTLLPSYLDIYSYQYELIDDMNVLAWRRVWEVWGDIKGHHRVAAPAFFDFFVYRLGQTTCRKTERRCLSSKSCTKLGREDCPAYGSDICPDGHCPFKDVCPDELKHLQPPKSISIYGRTGWQSGMTNEGGGLGITA